MARHDAKEKKGEAASAHAEAAAGKGASVPAPAMENGVCIICGEARMGTPAKPEIPVRFARRLRAVLKQPARHTVACREHLDEARQRRAKFEKKVRDYRLGALLFFAFVVLGSLAYGKLGWGLLAPAVLGALFVALLPYFYYFPSFGK